MCILFDSLVNRSSIFYRETILPPLSNLQKKFVAIALITLSCLAVQIRQSSFLKI